MPDENGEFKPYGNRFDVRTAECHYYDKVRPELIEAGIAKEYNFGAALTQVVDVVDETDYMLEKLRKNPCLFSHEYNK